MSVELGAERASDNAYNIPMTDDKPELDSNFEHQLKELEALVEKLESGDLDLDTSMNEFKRGVELTKRCRRLLDNARQVVEELQNPDDESSAKEFSGN